MSVSFDGIKVGDRVRLTRTNGIIRERAEFVVTGVESGLLWHESLWFKDVYWDKIKVLSPPKPTLPTIPGLYVSGEDWSLDLYALTDNGWQIDAHGCWGEVARADLPGDLVRLVPEGEPSALLAAARDALNLIDVDWSPSSKPARARKILSDAIEKAEAQS